MGKVDPSVWRNGLKADYERAFVTPWSPYVGALLLVMVVFAAMVGGLFWGVFGGIKLWGDWFNQLIGLDGLLGTPQGLESPLMHRISLMDITLVLGAFAAALLSRQFAVNRPPPLEYLWGALGGLLMGIGATLAGGCTVGGFLVPALHASPAGMAMWLGLVAGAAVGLKALMWTMEHITWGTRAPPVIQVPPRLQRLYPWLGLGIVAAVLAWANAWYGAGDEKLATRALIVPVGFAIGFVMHRSRFCVARAIREPFMTGEGEMSKAVILALALGIPLASLAFQAGRLDPFIGIPPRFWLGSLLGGAVFGIGMVFAGGCGTGSLWRMGEGHLKLWVAVFFFAWSGSTASALMHRLGWTVAEMNLDLIEESALGYQAYLPAMLGGWAWTYTCAGAFLLLWYLLVRYNESTERFTLF
ncbi:MAG: YeeE/YedE thiosulfate transporter family protein [Pseudomonadota bacterium]